MVQFIVFNILKLYIPTYYRIFNIPTLNNQLQEKKKKKEITELKYFA